MLLGDRAFCAYADLFKIKTLGCDAVFLKHQRRHTQMRRGKIVGDRIRTKFYQTGNGLLIHADVNGSLNILRKVVPTAFSLGIEEPLRWTGSPA